MKKYILNCDTFIDDLHDAAEVAAKHNLPTLAYNLTKHAEELRNLDIHTSLIDPQHEGNIYRLDCGDAKICWKRWQKKAFALAKKHDGQLFTYGTICDLVDRMNESVKVFKNAQRINNPDWMFCFKYGIRPAVGIGEGCTIVFQPVRGYYHTEEHHE